MTRVHDAADAAGAELDSRHADNSSVQDGGGAVVIVVGQVQAAITAEWVNEGLARSIAPFSLRELACLRSWREIREWALDWNRRTVIISEDTQISDPALDGCRARLGTLLVKLGARVVWTRWTNDGPEWLTQIETAICENRTLVDGALESGVPATLITCSGQPRPLLANALSELRTAPEWQGVISRDAFRLVTVARRETPWGHIGIWEDHHDALTAEWLQRRGICVSVATAATAVDVVAAENRWHPVREYLNGLKWDGKRRIDSWLNEYANAERCAYTEAVGSRWLISAVARIFSPGSQTDSVLVLEGRQGAGKSSAFRALAGAGEWFTDEVPELGRNSSEVAMHIQGIWIVEFSELDALSRAQVTRVRSFVTRRVDRFRRPYDRRALNAPRQCVFAGSINDRTYLRDEHGARRFWPIAVDNVDVEGIARDRDQIWAEAAAAYWAGRIWHISESETSLIEAAKAEQADRFEQDPWHELILSWCGNKESVSIGEILRECLEIDLKDWNQSLKRRVSSCLTAAGWTSFQHRIGQAREWRWQHNSRAMSAANTQ